MKPPISTTSYAPTFLGVLDDRPRAVLQYSCRTSLDYDASVSRLLPLVNSAFSRFQSCKWPVPEGDRPLSSRRRSSSSLDRPMSVRCTTVRSADQAWAAFFSGSASTESGADAIQALAAGMLHGDSRRWRTRSAFASCTRLTCSSRASARRIWNSLR